MCCVALCCVVLCCVVLCVLCCAVQCCVVWCGVVLCCVVWCGVVLCCVMLCDFVLCGVGKWATGSDEFPHSRAETIIELARAVLLDRLGKTVQAINARFGRQIDYCFSPEMNSRTLRTAVYTSTNTPRRSSSSTSHSLCVCVCVCVCMCTHQSPTPCASVCECVRVCVYVYVYVYLYVHSQEVFLQLRFRRGLHRFLSSQLPELKDYKLKTTSVFITEPLRF